MKPTFDFIKRVFKFEMPLIGLSTLFLYYYESCRLFQELGQLNVLFEKDYWNKGLWKISNDKHNNFNLIWTKQSIWGDIRNTEATTVSVSFLPERNNAGRYCKRGTCGISGFGRRSWERLYFWRCSNGNTG